jgi:carbamoyl-phosphate synthase large subunit
MASPIRSSRPGSSPPISAAVVVRPSYVLGGRAMAIIHDQTALDDLSARRAAKPGAVRRQGAPFRNDKTGQITRSWAKPLLFDRYLADAIEIDVDALSDGATVVVAGIMEHIEEAGIHWATAHAAACPARSHPRRS